MKQLQETAAKMWLTKPILHNAVKPNQFHVTKTEICGAKYRKYSAEHSYSQLSDGIQSFPLYVISHCMFMYDYPD
jgi:hypothetical protein